MYEQKNAKLKQQKTPWLINIASFSFFPHTQFVMSFVFAHSLQYDLIEEVCGDVWYQKWMSCVRTLIGAVFVDNLMRHSLFISFEIEKTEDPFSLEPLNVK